MQLTEKEEYIIRGIWGQLIKQKPRLPVSCCLGYGRNKTERERFFLLKDQPLKVKAKWKEKKEENG